MLELVALGTDHAAARQIATDLGGLAYINHEAESEKRPYSTMVRVSTDNIEAVNAVADVALHVAFARVIKAPSGPAATDRVIGTFGLKSHPDLGHRGSDDHWRDKHGPLALASHSAMCDYTQLSIVATVSGPALDGIAMCAFDSRQDLKEKFFNDDAARAAIQADVASFADVQSSPRRVVLTQIV